MKNIVEINGKNYKIYPEDKEESCLGCVFNVDDNICFHPNMSNNKNMNCFGDSIIYKEYNIKEEIIEWAEFQDREYISKWTYYLNLYLKSLGWNKKARKSFVSLGSDGFNFDRLDYVTLWYNFYYDVAQYFKEDISIETILKLHIAYRNIRINCDGTVIV